MALYFKIADKYNIIDKPNERSSHTLITVRGGGILFPLSALIYVLCFDFHYPWFISGLILISVVSFMDDISELNGKIRMAFQFISTILICIQAKLFSIPLYFVIPIVVFIVAAVNAWNFMDGINGITGGYSLLTVFTFIFINDQIIQFTSTGFMIAIALSLLVFVFYNFRTQARCFAGDVGSVSIGFIIIFLMIQLLIASKNPNYILILLIYGLDSFSTVFFRVLRGENILKPHRSHLYQYLANEYGMPHNTVSLIYVFSQLLINAIVIYFAVNSVTSFTLIILIAYISFIGIRFVLEGKTRLIGKS